MDTLLEIEKLCQQLYSSSPLRTEAEKVLTFAFPTFTDSDVAIDSVSSQLTVRCLSPNETLVRCQWVLDNSSDPLTELFAINRLTILLLKQFSLFSTTETLALRISWLILGNFILNYLARHPNLPSFIISGLSQLLCSVTKMAWFDDSQFQSIVEDVLEFVHV
jgi:hypothetical protein